MQKTEAESLLTCRSFQAGQQVIDHLFGKGLLISVETLKANAQNTTDEIKYILHHSGRDAAVITGEISGILHTGHYSFQSL